MMISLSKRLIGIASAVLLGAWSLTQLSLTLLGLAMLPDDWRQVMSDQLPDFLGWLFSTPWWVPGILAVILTAWVMWITRPTPPAVARTVEPTPLLKMAAEMPSQPTISAPDDVEAPNPAPCLPFEPKGLYVGLMQIDSQHASEKGLIEIRAICFNATGRAIDVQQILGAVRVFDVKGGTRTDLGRLLQPRFSGELASMQNIGNLTIFKVVLEQPVPPHIVSMLAGLRGAHTLEFVLDEMDIAIGLHGSPNPVARLPLWGGISVGRDGDCLQSRRFSTLKTMPITIQMVTGRA